MADLTNKERIAQQVRPIQVGNAGLAIFGQKFEDLGPKPDGIRQNTEPGLANVRFVLEPAATSNGVFNASSGEAQTTTDANGAFSFINLVPGEYVVTEQPFAGFTATTPPRLLVTLDTKNANVLFGNTRNATSAFSNIIGCKYLDLDGDGFRDGNEPGIRNVRIFLDGSNKDGTKTTPNGILDPGEYETLTDKNGEWSFKGLTPGTYKVRELVTEPRLDLLNFPITGNTFNSLDQNNQYPQTLAKDFPQTTPPPKNVPLLDVTVAAGETFSCAQVGDTQFYKIVVNKFQDLNRNGRRDNIAGTNTLEPPVTLVPFILDVNKNGKYDVGEEIRFTDANGEATFRDLPAGNYPVLEIFNPTLSQGLLAANKNQPSLLPLLALRSELTTGVSATEFRPGNLNLPVATTPNPLMVVAPGPLATPQSTISRNDPFLVADNYTLQPQDPKFLDLNGDGFQQLPGEVPIPLTGVRPIYTSFDKTPVPFPALNPSPSVVFSPIAPNNTVAGNTGVGNTRPNINVFKYEDLNANGRYDALRLPSGALNPSLTANGELPNVSGVSPTGEKIRVPVKVFIDLNNDEVRQEGEQERTTDVNGRAVFQNLTPGTYTVREVVPAGFLPSTPAVVTFTVNTEDANVTFGNTPTSTITGCKFEDFNQNGYRDGNEPAIAGVTIAIDNNSNGALDAGDLRTTTDRFGMFSFTGLRPGTYKIREVLPSGYFKTTQPVDVVLGPNQTFTCALVGNSRLYDLLVPKFQDDDRNGVRNGSEKFLPGIPFTLDLNNNGTYDPATEKVVRTDANGIARFNSLSPGTYSVLEIFDDPSVTNPFPIRTGPNPVNFSVPGPDTVPTTTVTPPDPSGIVRLSSLDPLTGDTGVAAASIDPLTNGGSSAVVEASSVDSLLAPESAGAMSFVDFNGLKDAAEASIVTFLEAQKLDEPKLLLGAPTTTPLF